MYPMHLTLKAINDELAKRGHTARLARPAAISISTSEKLAGQDSQSPEDQQLHAGGMDRGVS